MGTKATTKLIICSWKHPIAGAVFLLSENALSLPGHSFYFLTDTEDQEPTVNVVFVQ